MTDQPMPTDRLVDAVTAIVAAKWGPCADYLCESKRTGAVSAGALTRSTVADVLEALGSTPYGVLLDVAAEMDAQDDRWGEQNHPDGTGGENTRNAATGARLACQLAAKDGDLTWRHIMREEIAEAFAETDPIPLRTEVIQAAAVGAQWARSIDRR